MKRAHLFRHAAVRLIVRAKRLARPIRPVRVAQASRRILHIGFELKDRLAELLIPLMLHSEERAKEPISMTIHETRQHLQFELAGELEVACEISGIKECCV